MQMVATAGAGPLNKRIGKMARVTIGLGEAGEIDVDGDKFNSTVQEYIFNYGLKQMLNDVHASVTKKVTADDDERKAQKLALVQKKLDSLYAGEVAQARVGRAGSPVEREMQAMAEADLKAKLAAIGKKVKDFNKEVWAEVVAKQVKANEEAYRAAAEAKLAIRPDTGEFDIMSLLEGAEEEAPAGETPAE